MLVDGTTCSENEVDSVKSIDTSEFSIFSDKFGEILKNLSAHLLEMPEVEMVETFDFNSTDWLLRRRFNEVFERAKANKIETIPQTEIYDGITTKQNWYASYLSPGKEHKIAWIIRPIRDYREICDQAFNVAMEKVLQFVLKNKVSESNLTKIVRLMEFTATRKYGPVVQKLQIHQRNENINLPGAKDVTPQLPPQDLRDQLTEVTAKLIEPSSEKPTED